LSTEKALKENVIKRLSTRKCLNNKVTTSIKNQAINKTEGLVNDKANTFLNTFGAGRSEVSIGGISAKKLTYSHLTWLFPVSANR
jgi:predicted flavoprotein YhiN